MNRVWRDYEDKKREIRYYMQKIRDITEFANRFAEEERKEGMESIMDPKRVTHN